MQIVKSFNRMRLAAACIAFACCSSGLAAGPRQLLLLHLDFNTIQMRKEAVTECLRTAAEAGYNAVLWEVEDKIRWETCPECVHPEAFTKSEFREILSEARRLGLEPVPLLQTFGHAEYVLINGNHRQWMEDPAFPACYCVSNPEVRRFLRRLLDEYLELFGSDVRHFHLGGDEAKVFGTCRECRKSERMKLYVSHLKYMAEPLSRRNIKPGVWCDMILGESSDFKAAELPKEFTVWLWDYVYDGKPGGKMRKWTRHADLLVERGHDIVFAAASASHGDGPFLPQYGFHNDNVAAAAERVRRENMLGLCVTSWSVRKCSKLLQMPIWDYAAKRFLRPSPDPAKDEADSFRKYFGDVPPEILRRLTVWEKEYCAFDASGWFALIKHARPAPAGTFERIVGQHEASYPGWRGRLAGKAARTESTIGKALADLGGCPGSTPARCVLTNAVDLSLSFLSSLRSACEGGDVRPRKSDTKAHYLREQTPQSAGNCAEIVWSIIGRRRADAKGE